MRKRLEGAKCVPCPSLPWWRRDLSAKARPRSIKLSKSCCPWARGELERAPRAVGGRMNIPGSPKEQTPGRTHGPRVGGGSAESRFSRQPAPSQPRACGRRFQPDTGTEGMGQNETGAETPADATRGCWRARGVSASPRSSCSQPAPGVESLDGSGGTQGSCRSACGRRPAGRFGHSALHGVPQLPPASRRVPGAAPGALGWPGWSSGSRGTPEQGGRGGRGGSS